MDHTRKITVHIAVIIVIDQFSENIQPQFSWREIEIRQALMLTSHESTVSRSRELDFPLMLKKADWQSSRLKWCISSPVSESHAICFLFHVWSQPNKSQLNYVWVFFLNKKNVFL